MTVAAPAIANSARRLTRSSVMLVTIFRQFGLLSSPSNGGARQDRISPAFGGGARARGRACRCRQDPKPGGRRRAVSRGEPACRRRKVRRRDQKVQRQL